MKRIVFVEIATIGLVLWAHQSPEIGARVPMVFVALWLGSATIVALIFSIEGFNPRFGAVQPTDAARQSLWRYKMRVTILSLLPLTLVPLLESTRRRK